MTAAEQALAARRYDEALEAARAAGDSRVEALALVQLRRLDEADRLLAAIATAEDAGLSAALATLRLVQGRTADALAAAEAALARDPDRVEALVMRAQVRAAQGEIATGLADAERAAALAPGLAAAQAVHGRLLRRAERIGEAIQPLRRAVAAEPGHGPWRALLAEALAEALRFAEAEPEWRAAIAADPGQGRLRGQLAASLAELGRLDEAEAEARAGMELAPKDPLPPLTLASILLARPGDAAEALACCERALALHPGSARAVALKGVALDRLGRFDAAAAHLAMDRLVQPLRPPVPAPFDERADFHRALVAGIDADRSLAWEPAATTTRMGYQTRNLLRHQTPEFLALRRLILGAVERYVAAVRDHPWFQRFPQRVSVYAWATVLQSGGRQLDHIHPSATVSGVYYVAVPAVVSDRGTDGWIEFGRPPELFHPPGDAPVRRLQPQEGLMVLFPSWLYHRTFPFEATERRISIAFDVMAG
ncbi:putative 2OG-Fe(II) oxygenase [Stella sp.]|uniref:putative 2OG-Fe(II) oxygenase n=1 Tax=Stella sp. TaxID=2912054 RepID=UPI0035B29810